MTCLYVTQDVKDLIEQIKKDRVDVYAPLLDSGTSEDAINDIIKNDINTVSNANGHITPTLKMMKKFYDSKNKISEFQGFSGKADGSDKAWFNIGQRYGIPIKNYRPYHLNKDNIRECETAVSIANRTLKRDIDKMREAYYNASEAEKAKKPYAYILRDWLQVKDADAVFAVAKFHSKDFTSTVDGGTGWAVQMAIDNGKSVHIFDLDNNVWKTWNGKSWIIEDTPTLTSKFAGIGTRELTDIGKQAIEDVYSKSVHKEPSYLETELSPANIEYTLQKANMTFATTQEREDRVSLIARMFSQVTTALYNQAKANNLNLKRNTFIVQNLENILSLTQQMFADNETYDSKRRRGFQQIRDNWYVLLDEAFDILHSTEGIAASAVDLNTFNSNESAAKQEEMNDDEDSEYLVKDGWMIKAREIDLRDTLSEQVRKILNNIKRVDKNGKEETDDLGFIRYINPDYAHLKLIEELSGIYKSDEFDSTLQKMTKKYPWVQSIINTLNNTEDYTIKPLFYNDLRREFVPWWVQVNNGTKQVNKHPGIYYLFNEWRNNYEGGLILDEDSVYDKNNDINVDNAKIGLDLCANLNNLLSKSDNVEDILEESLPTIKKLLNMIGIDFTEEDIQDTINLDPKKNFTTIVNQLAIVFREVSEGKVKNDVDFINEFDGVYTTIAQLFNIIPEGSTLATFREVGKTYQSYTAPSYLGRLLNGIHSAKWEEVFTKEFKSFRQFYIPSTGYRSDWLRKLASGQKFRDIISRKVVLHRDRKKFNDWTEADHMKAQIDEFFSIPTTEGTISQAWYALPLLSDAESAEFIRFVRYITDEDGTVEDKVITQLVDEVLNEFERIKLVIARAEARKNGTANHQPIANYDITLNEKGEIISKKNGSEFKFFPALNNFKVTADLVASYDFLTEGQLFTEALSNMLINHPNRVKSFISDVLKVTEEAAFNKFYKEALKVYGNEAEDGSITADPIRKDSTFKADIKEYFYNNALAYTQMVRMTTTDLSFYKDLNDFQKRYKEVYAMTLRPYIASKYGKKTMKVVVLKDIEHPSKILEKVTAALYARANDPNDSFSKLDADYIISQYKKVNVTDAQGFRTLRSYRTILDMVGKWTPEMDAALERLENNTFDVNDFNIIWQTLKPFMFTQHAVKSDVTLNVNGVQSDYGNIKCPVQIKNSEAILMALYSTIAANTVGTSGTLRGLQKWMDTRGIDTANFESAVKVGLQAPIDVSSNAINSEIARVLDKTGKNINEEEAIINILDRAAYPNRIEDTEVVHNLDYEDDGIQVATGEHLMDHEDVLGSQFKKLIEADLPDDIQLIIPGIDHPVTKQELHNLYQSLLTENILERFREVSDEFSDIEKVAELIEKEMKGNSRYTDEERIACKLVERDGKKVFNIPLYDPIFGDKIQNLLFSIIKKKITKQTTKRATCVQATSWGVSDELSIRYKDSKGNLIFNEKEWRGIDKVPQSQVKNLKALKKQFKTYQEYDAQFGDKSARAVAYYEVYLPAYSKSFFEPLLDKDGNLDINKLPEDLRKCIGLRVPTEAKYSMQPIYIKGFLPSAMGSVIMFPEEITLIVGSDFDIDKVLINLPEFEIQKYEISRALYDYKKYLKSQDISAEDALINAIFGEVEDNQEILDEDSNNEGESETLAFKEWFKQHKNEYLLDTPIIKKIKYNYSKSANNQGRGSRGRKARNNAIIDCAWAILTNEKIVAQISKPGGFDEVSRVGAIVTILKNTKSSDFSKIHPEGKSTFKDFFSYVTSLDKDKAKALVAELQERLDPLSPSTQIYFHAQNANGGKMIPVYAVGNAAHAEGQWCNIELKKSFNIFGRQYKKIDNILTPDGKLISENLGQFLAGSVDNVKDPVLKALNQSGKTGATTVLMLRLGMTISEVGLLMSAPYIREKYKDVAPIQLTESSIAWAINVYNTNNLEDLSDRDRNLLYGILNSIKHAVDTLNDAGKALRDITSMARGDSSNAAGGPTAGHVILRYLKLLRLKENLQKDDFPISADLLDLDFILNGKYYDLNSCYKSGVPFLQAATKCGVIGPMKLLQPYFPQFKPEVLDLLINEEYGLARYINLLDLKEDDAIKVINKFFNEFYLYNLSGTEYFGKNGSSDDTRTNLYQYIMHFPEYFKTLVAKYPELQNNELISSLQVHETNKYNVVPKIKFKSTGNLSKHQSNKLTKDWQMLLQSPNEEIVKLGYQLFKYGHFYGLTYAGPQTFTHRAPMAVRTTIPDYFKCLESIMESTGVDYKPFILQFIRNNYLEAKAEIIPERDIISMRDDELILPKQYNKKQFVRILKNRETMEMDYYMYTSGGTDESPNCTFTLITPLGHVSGIKEYYFGKSQIDTAIPHKEVRQSQQEDIYAESDYNTPYDMEEIEERGWKTDSAELEYNKNASPILGELVYDDAGNLICG